MDWRKILFIAVLTVTLIGSFWYLYDFASRPDLRDYIGDEVWYVPASRNVLHRLGVNLHYVNETTNAEGINVIFSNTSLRIMYGYEVEKIALRYNATYEFEYLKFPGLYFEIPLKNVEGFLDSLSSEIPPDAYYTVPGYRYPDKENIQNYLNTEHPFLGKDLITLGMLIEDKPINWRLPGIIAFVLIGILVVLATYEISGSYLASLIALAFTVADPTLQATAVAAMLDIHVALFVALFTALLIYERRRSSAFAIGLAAAAKLSGAFGYPVLLVKAFREERKLVNFLMTIAVLPALGFLLPNLTIIKVLGFEGWVREILGSFRWHLSSKGGHPAASPVWDWFINRKAFPFHYDPNVFAQTDPFLLLSMVIFIFALPWLYRRRGKLLVPYGVFWSIVGFFTLQYVLGGTTQFSFYATVLVPPAAIVMGVALKELLRWEAFIESLWVYWEFLLGAKDWLLRRLKISR
ncbi:dolichyl-phosphate-mannose--protein mannosyltransferase [Thermococcus celer]|uniref:Dolichyl-phosphate-mannose--protein mannosyltransferase n=1 Tax=Thermococcus celer Vu 13 = JCM 8558 TaxID=1293037 RepID=A0A218P3S4_THECE|nr:dolichyl-phosphate-mannose--protein mannosyltransferase [Thermococcus celer]ASI99580.1 dolichyl-phosphate-mannose--protein mannosyltransferase [Thermococcus celer Vu 13 = JCM 8558]